MRRSRKEKSDYHLINLTTLVLGGLIVWFNVLGYDILFPDEGFIMSPFSWLLLFAEIAVLLWTSTVIKNWHSTGRLLKCAMFVLVPAFWFLCYAGINSYLNDTATSSEQVVKTAENRDATKQRQIQELEKDIEAYGVELNALRTRNHEIDQQVEVDSKELAAISIQDSERRKTARDCSQSPDCAAAIANFKKQMDSLNRNIENSQTNKEANSANIRDIERQIIDSRAKVSELRTAIADSNNLHSEAKTESERKKAMYIATVNKVSSWFGVKFDDPFGAFVSFISALIYPVYFILNLLSSMNTPEHNEKRKQKASLRKERADLRDIAVAKLLKYMRVWAHRRNKTIEVEKVVEVPVDREVEVEKIIEVPVEIEKEVERIVEVEKVVEIEVEKEVERIVEVEKIVEVEIEKIVEVPVEMEVPVYVDRVHKVSEPMVVKEPQIIIHERIVPIPENITSEQLEELLHAQSRSNQTTRVESAEMAEDSASERTTDAA